MPDALDPLDAAGEQRELLAQLKAVVEAKDAENAMLQAELAAERELRRRLELRAAELERRLGMDSTNSGTPTSGETSGRGSAAKRSGRGGIPPSESAALTAGGAGSPATGRGPGRDPDPDQRETADPPAQCSWCEGGLDGAQPAQPGWAQVGDVTITRVVTEWLPPALICPCCGQAATPAGRTRAPSRTGRWSTRRRCC